MAALLFWLHHSLSPGQFNPVNHPFGWGEMPERGVTGAGPLLRRPSPSTLAVVAVSLQLEGACGLRNQRSGENGAGDVNSRSSCIPSPWAHCSRFSVSTCCSWPCTIGFLRLVLSLMAASRSYVVAMSLSSRSVWADDNLTVFNFCRLIAQLLLRGLNRA